MPSLLNRGLSGEAAKLLWLRLLQVRANLALKRKSVPATMFRSLIEGVGPILRDALRGDAAKVFLVRNCHRAFG